MYTSTFFKWIICYENGKKWAKIFKVYRINVFFPLNPSLPKRVCLVHSGLTLTIMDVPIIGPVLFHFYFNSTEYLDLPKSFWSSPYGVVQITLKCTEFYLLE